MLRCVDVGAGAPPVQGRQERRGAGLPALDRPELGKTTSENLRLR